MRLSLLALSVFLTNLALANGPQGAFGKGQVLVLGAGPNEVSVSIQGDAAKALYEHLDSSLEQKPTPPLTSFVKKGQHVSCKKWEADPANNRPEKFSCGVNFDTQGEAKPFLVKVISGVGGVGN